ncbi:hypothetical protein FOZ62_032004 [Perkinsus olseni]|uniref:Uncharacterized protein n=1 Tax=Perkinsus olseni TaxID=32597 RepID=A0A7J6RTQ2_PEROL|nr:hypothetical protein FOZ62_032004 [Perkinsus olseni]
MRPHPLLQLFLSFLSATALRRSARGKTSQSAARNAGPISELKAKGISFSPKASGCKIEQSDPLPRMSFTLTVEGSALDTEFDDFENKTSFNFYKSTNMATWGGDEDDDFFHTVFLKDGDWERFYDLKLLPLAHLTWEKLEKIRKLITPRRKNKVTTETQCLGLVEVISAHPPSEYYTPQKTTGWVSKFYADNRARIEEELESLERGRQDTSERGAESGQQSGVAEEGSAFYLTAEEESKRIAELKAQGISFYPDISGCKIEQSSPLRSMNFTVYVNERALDTTFEDYERGDTFYFSQSANMILWGVDGDDDDDDNEDNAYRGVYLGQKDWKSMEELKWLPLTHLSEGIRAMLLSSTPKRGRKLSTVSQCLRVVEAIMSNPSPEYQTDRETTDWLYDFYDDKREEMKEKLAELEELQENDEARQEETSDEEKEDLVESLEEVASGNGRKAPPADNEPINFYPDVSGCMMTGKRIRLSLTADRETGAVMETEVWDEHKQKTYYLSKKTNRINCGIGGILNFGVPLEDKDWRTLEQSGLLPFSHLSEDTLRTLRENTPPQANTYDTKSQCLDIVEVILADPPSPYGAHGGALFWIADYHRDNKDDMWRAFVRMSSARRKMLS